MRISWMVTVCLQLSPTYTLFFTSSPKVNVHPLPSSSSNSHGGSIGFSITLIPNCTFCLGSLILTRGVQSNAFDAGFTTVDQIFDQPNLEHVDLVPLPCILSTNFSLGAPLLGRYLDFTTKSNQ
ncbi:hypothetical protein F5Y17DRAFT_238235 [Xylariaceae sp. FL0594]|nr:hypothetical protein F5Y17DRAFT_238235 [Xylariaceae sp. FL0594]